MVQIADRILIVTVFLEIGEGDVFNYISGAGTDDILF
jgi:hypothetical protein